MSKTQSEYPVGFEPEADGNPRAIHGHMFSASPSAEAPAPAAESRLESAARTMRADGADDASHVPGRRA